MIQTVVKNLERLHVKEILNKEDKIFLSRQEYKFIVPLHLMGEILDYLKHDFFYSHFDEDFIYKYHNIYFDTADYKFFKLHRQGKYNRIKLRIRNYKNGIQNKFIECKRKVRGIKIKKERKQINGEISDFDLLNQSFILKDLKKYGLSPNDIKNKTEILYSRINLHSKDAETRITIDFDISAKNDHSDSELIAPNFFVLEIKSKKYPKEIAKFLRQNYKIQEQSFSKYCVSLCILNKDLKNNKWKQTLKKYF